MAKQKTAGDVKLLNAVFIFVFFAANFFFLTPSCFAKTQNKTQGQDKLTPISKPAPANSARAGSKFVISGEYVHLSCSKSIRDLANNKLDCYGNVYIRRPGELLTADYAQLDLSTEKLRAEGNVVYITTSTIIYGQRIEYDLSKSVGTIYEGRIENDKFFILGEKIERVGPNRYLVKQGEYSTCRDCPSSWRLLGKEVDFTIDGYAFLNQVFVKINESPTVYLPYIVIPVKTSRQTGLIFPKMRLQSPNGFQLVLPFFWAISENMDATIGAGYYSRRGYKGEAEYRFNLAPRTQGVLKGFYLRDKSFIGDPIYNRWAIDYNHNIELPWGIDQKLSYIDASDRDYPRKIPGDLDRVNGEPAMVSEASISKSTRTASAWVGARRVRNILTPDLVGFDPDTVQVLPSLNISSLDHRLSKNIPLHWGLTTNYTRFWRIAPSFDNTYPDDYAGPRTGTFIPGVNPIRRADRYNINPELYYATNLFGFLDFIPSVRYRSYFYVFDKDVAGPTARGFLQTKAEIGTTVERVYGGSFKHKFRPSIVYSRIPYVVEDQDHAFIKQLKNSENKFDEYDIVPLNADSPLYTTPQGNALTYLVSNKLIHKETDVGGVVNYRKSIDILSGQTVNFAEFQKDKRDQRPLTRFFTLASISTLHLSGYGEFFYYPYIDKPTYSLNFRYTFAKYTRRYLAFERSLGLSYNVNGVVNQSKSIGGSLNWSFNDYISVRGGLNYEFPRTLENNVSPGRILNWNAGAVYQSPSQCFQFLVNLSWDYQNRGITFETQIPINLTGQGFMNFLDPGSAGGSPQ